MDFEVLEANRHQMNVAIDSIEYMKEIIIKNNLKNVLEIGCFNGFSAIHFSSVAKQVKTIEIDSRSIQEAKKNLSKFNIKNVEILEGDALDILAELNEKFDLVFIDAMKKEYSKYLTLVLPLLNEGGFIFADNTISHKDKMDDFFEYLQNSNLDWRETNLGKKNEHVAGLVEIRI
ncbi:class I SAM-dependent methyltransferase [Candidatus Woesearchaeota archaeon]|nr:class I SAM-dependent methyltransferase [Candidatus Woesearchaeota archaeon]